MTAWLDKHDGWCANVTTQPTPRNHTIAAQENQAQLSGQACTTGFRMGKRSDSDSTEVIAVIAT